MPLDPILDRVDDNFDAAIARLFEFIAIPSISADPAYAGDCRKAADWLTETLRSIGAAADTIDTEGLPIVLGRLGEKGPHFLFYGHYDVQPVDPLELWDHDPFSPFVQDDPDGPRIRGRGASDDKGQLMTFVEACRAWIDVKGELPFRVTFLIEGEEETSSPSLEPFLKARASALQADYALICDTALHDSRIPAITTMLRGWLGEELTITAADQDLHSGVYGGAAINPIRVLSKIIASLHDENGRITIPHFYDGVSELSDTLRDQWEALGFDALTFLDDVGLSEPAGERDRSVLEMVWSRPTCDVNGVTGGYAGEGFKTVLPAQASAKISFRLVGDQDPWAIRDNFRAMVRSMLPPDCRAHFKDHGASRASHFDEASAVFAQASEALSEEWPEPARFIGGGGSIPVAAQFEELLGLQALMIGFAKDNDQVHAPNEKYDIACFHKGTRSWVRVLAALSESA